MVRGSGLLWRLLVVAAVLRIVGLLSAGHGGDITAFIEWAEGTVEHGLSGYYAAGGDSNYPPMLYLLYPLGVVFDGAELAYAVRLLSIPFDLALGVLLFKVVADETGRERDGAVAAAFYLLNPAVLMSGPIWGQVDGMGALPMVASIVAAARGRVVLAGSMAVLAGLIKPQFGIAGFVLAGLALFWLRTPEGIRRTALLALSALVTFTVVLFPLALSPLGYFDVMRDTFTRYPYISQFGFNPWGMVFGFGDDDAQWALVGTALAVAGIAASLWQLRRRRDLVGLLGVSVLIGLVIYFLPTRVHERYLFGAIAFLAPLAAMERRLVWPFVALSAAAFLTVAYVAVTSPYSIFPVAKWDEFPQWGISLMSAATTLVGAWAAVRVLELFRSDRKAEFDARPAPEAASAGSG
jgi:hypothetical protein